MKTGLSVKDLNSPRIPSTAATAASRRSWAAAAPSRFSGRSWKKNVRWDQGLACTEWTRGKDGQEWKMDKGGGWTRAEDGEEGKGKKPKGKLTDLGAPQWVRSVADTASMPRLCRRPFVGSVKAGVIGCRAGTPRGRGPERKGRPGGEMRRAGGISVRELVGEGMKASPRPR